MIGEARSFTWQEARALYLGLPPAEAPGAGEPSDPPPEAVTENDLEQPATPEPPRCEICED